MLGSGGIEHPAAALRSAQSRSRPVRRQQRQRSRAGSLPNVDRRIRRKICPGAVRTFRHKVAAQYFRTGLFENPYVDPDRTEATVGNPEFMQAGYEAQLRSVVLLKNRAGTLPASTRRSVYLPECGQSRLPVDTSLVKQYYELAESPENADFAIVLSTNPTEAADTMRPIGKRAATVMSRSACNTATTRPATHAPRVLPAGTRKNRPSTGVTAGKPSGVPTGKS